MKTARYPRHTHLFNDLTRVIEDYVLADYIPSQPIISRGGIIRTQGSCFAENIANALKRYDLKINHLLLPEAVNSPLANRVLYDHLTNPAKAYAHPLHETLVPPAVLSALRQDIPKESVFILTLGIASTWFLKGTNLPTIQIDTKARDKYERRFESVDENLDHIRFIISAARALNPAINIVITVSPVPLNVDTNRGSAVVSDFLSKATLRFAVESYLGEKHAGVYYWPAFEIVRWLGAHLPPVFGADDGESRHVNNELVELIVSLFLKYYATSEVLESRLETTPP